MGDPDHFNRVMRDPGYFRRLTRDRGHFNQLMRDPGLFTPKIQDSKPPDCSETMPTGEKYTGDNREELSNDTVENQPEILETPLARVSTSDSSSKPKWFLRFMRDQPQPKNSLARLM